MKHLNIVFSYSTQNNKPENSFSDYDGAKKAYKMKIGSQKNRKILFVNQHVKTYSHALKSFGYYHLKYKYRKPDRKPDPSPDFFLLLKLRNLMISKFDGSTKFTIYRGEVIYEISTMMQKVTTK